MADHPSAALFMVGHVHLKVRDLGRALAFYTDVLELQVTEQYEHYAFLSWGDRHHDIALQEVGPGAADPPPSSVGLYHAAFEVRNKDAFARMYERLQDEGVRVSPIDHGISKALYFQDPAGNGLEVYLDTRETNNQRTWDGVNRRFDPAELLTS